MANSQTMSTDNQYIKYYIECVLNSQNIANNTSNVYVRVVAYRTNTGYTTSGSGTCYCKINGTIYSAPIDNNDKITNSGCTLFEKTLDIPHNADGTKTLDMTSWISHSKFSGSEQGWSYGLTTIPRATTPTLSVSSVELGKELTISTAPASTTFYHGLRYAFAGSTGGIVNPVGISYTWTVPLSLANQIPSSTSGILTIYCDTYASDGTLIGTKSVNVTVTVPTTIIPSISSIVCSDPNKYATTYGGYVQKKSKLKVQVTSAGSYSSTITKVSISAMGVTSTSNPYTSGVITDSAGAKSVIVTVTDSRGRTATKMESITVLGYSSPTITKLSVSRCDSSGNANDDGSYMKITYAGSITTLNNKNSKNILVRYKKQTTSTWTNAVNVSEYSRNTSVVVSADTESSYDVSFVLTDAFSSVERTAKLSTAFTLMDFRSTGKGIGIGKVSEKDNVLDVASDWTIQGGRVVGLQASSEATVKAKSGEGDIYLYSTGGSSGQSGIGCHPHGTSTWKRIATVNSSGALTYGAGNFEGNTTIQNAFVVRRTNADNTTNTTKVLAIPKNSSYLVIVGGNSGNGAWAASPTMYLLSVENQSGSPRVTNYKIGGSSSTSTNILTATHDGTNLTLTFSDTVRVSMIRLM